MLPLQTTTSVRSMNWDPPLNQKPLPTLPFQKAFRTDSMPTVAWATRNNGRGLERARGNSDTMPRPSKANSAPTSARQSGQDLSFGVKVPRCSCGGIVEASPILLLWLWLVHALLVRSLTSAKTAQLVHSVPLSCPFSWCLLGTMARSRLQKQLAARPCDITWSFRGC